jgi:hypothetical protein
MGQLAEWLPLTEDSPDFQREYLGDGVYVEINAESNALTLFTANGIRETNRVVLEPEVLAKFEAFLERLRTPTITRQNRKLHRSAQAFVPLNPLLQDSKKETE